MLTFVRRRRYSWEDVTYVFIREFFDGESEPVSKDDRIESRQ